MTRSVPWHPTVIITAFVLFNLYDNGVHLAATGRAFLVAILIAVSIQAVLSLLFGRHRGSAAATGVIAMVIFWVPIKVIIDHVFLLSVVQILTLACLLILLVVYVGWLVRARRFRVPMPEVTRALNLTAIVLIGVVTVSLATSPLGSRLIGDLGIGSMSATTTPTAGERPDVYVVVLDSYPRSDALEDYMAHDNAEFLRQLEQVGLDVAHDARANYSWTTATLLSMLNMRLLDELPPINALLSRTALNQTESFDLLRSHGYQIVAVGPPSEHVALRDADRFVDGGYLNSFECHLIRRTALGSLAWATWPSFIGEDRRAGIATSLQAARDIAADGDGQPTFVLVHLPVPHLPVLWDRAGQPVEDPTGSECAPQDATGMERDDLREAYIGTLERSGELVLEAVGDILATAEPEPIVIVMSDHGAHFGGPTPNTTDPAAWRDEFGVLLAVHTPAKQNLFAEDVSLVAVLATVFNQYLGTHLPIEPDLSFWPDGSVAAEP